MSNVFQRPTAAPRQSYPPPACSVLLLVSLASVRCCDPEEPLPRAIFSMMEKEYGPLHGRPELIDPHLMIMDSNGLNPEANRMSSSASFLWSKLKGLEN
ncbi:hypothetical protein ACP70R_010360 [Stipagrostis hirtigluma subsp. patula]